MIVFDEGMLMQFPQFGIEIPLADTRVLKVLEHIPQEFLTPLQEEITQADIERVHTHEYCERLLHSDTENALITTYELMFEGQNSHYFHPEKASKPLKELLPAIFKNASASYQVGKMAIECQKAYALGGGMHHAFPHRGRGFCPIHDVAIALRRLQAEEKIKTAWIIDVDAHKGDGTALIFHNNPQIIDLSIHMKRGWPLNGQIPQDELELVQIPAQIDIPIEENENYLENLSRGLEQLRSQSQKPDICYIIHGADPFIEDELPSSQNIQLSLEDIKKRDEIIHNFLQIQSIPQAYVMGGGYGQKVYQVYLSFLHQFFTKN